MTKQTYTLIVTIIVAVTFFLAGYFTANAQSVSVSLTIPCSNENWEHSPRCTAPVAEFTETTDGFYGTLTSGVEFKQTRITPYMHLFRLEKVCWLTYKDVTVYCDV